MMKKPFDELAETSTTHHYDIGVVGLWYGINYGSVLTYFALYCLLRDLGYDAVMLPKPNRLWEDKFYNPDTLGQKFIRKYCNVLEKYETQEQYVFANDACDDFIVGSDVVWSYKFCGSYVDQHFFLDWVKSGHKKISYASSIETGQLEGSKSYLIKAEHNLKKFDAISVREKRSINFLNELGIRSVQQVLDPVFVCNPKIYTELIDDVIGDDKKFVIAYILNKKMPKIKGQVLVVAANEFDAEVRVARNPNRQNRDKKFAGFDVADDLSIEEWLSGIKNCKFYIGDSYHGLCFALIFHKPFIVIFSKSWRSYPRIESLLDIVGLQHRLICDETVDEDTLRNLMHEEIDWDEVDRRLTAMQEFSKNWLIEALTLEPRNSNFKEYIHDAYLDVLANMSSKVTILNNLGRVLKWAPRKVKRLLNRLRGLQ